MPGGGPLPEYVMQEERDRVQLANTVYRIFVFPLPFRPPKESPPAAIFGAVIWTLLLSLGATYFSEKLSKTARPTQRSS